MKKFMKIICMLVPCLTMFMILSSGKPNADIQPEYPEEYLQLNLLFPKTSDSISDANLIIKKINEYIQPLIGVRIDITFVGDSYNQIANQKLASNEQVDIAYCSSYSILLDWYEQKRIKSLDDLLADYGTGILNAIESEYIGNGSINGEIYAVPSNRDMAANVGLEYRKDIAEKYGIDMSGVESYRDLTAVFEQVKENCPDIIPFASMKFGRFWDNLGDDYGVLVDITSSEIVNLYETAEFVEMIQLAYEWNRKGFMLDTISNSGNNFYYFRSGEIFSSFARGKPGFETQETRTIGKKMGFLEIYSPYKSTSNLNGSLYTIPNNSVDPEKAMAFLNLMYSDPIISNLLIYGIEGSHYIFADKENGVITFPEGVDANTSGYAQFEGWKKGNQFISYVWEGDPLDVWEQTNSFNRNATRSKAYGFRFDNSAVQNEILKCDKVREKYLNGLQSGILNPDHTLQEFQLALQEAGIQTIIAEKQRQLDEWIEK